MAKAVLETQTQQPVLSGELSFTTVPELWQDVQALLNASSDAAAEQITVDLSRIERSDSSGVALLVAWLAHAQQLGQAVRFVNAPEQMRALVHVAGLTELLGWGKSTTLDAD